MSHHHVLSVLGLAALTAVALTAEPARAASLDSMMYGMWVLDTAHSQFGGPYPAPKSGLVNWTEHGWVFAVMSADGLYADAAVIDHGCILVGVPRPYTCQIDIVTPTHVHLILRNGDRTEREGDIELVDDNTQRIVHRVTPADGTPYTETTLWTRAH